MQITGRLHAGKNQFLECHRGSPLTCACVMPR
jgi:hypothetical protein